MHKQLITEKLACLRWSLVVTKYVRQRSPNPFPPENKAQMATWITAAVDINTDPSNFGAQYSIKLTTCQVMTEQLCFVGM